MVLHSHSMFNTPKLVPRSQHTVLLWNIFHNLLWSAYPVVTWIYIEVKVSDLLKLIICLLYHSSHFIIYNPVISARGSLQDLWFPCKKIVMAIPQKLADYIQTFMTKRNSLDYNRNLYLFTSIPSLWPGISQAANLKKNK